MTYYTMVQLTIEVRWVSYLSMMLQMNPLSTVSTPDWFYMLLQLLGCIAILTTLHALVVPTAAFVVQSVQA